MDADTLHALELSIKHWEENVAAKDVADISVGAIACPLCKKFYGDGDYESESCKGCPVQERTGISACQKTPYSAAYYAWNDLIMHPELIQERMSKWLRCQVNAQAELDFLKSLLPKNDSSKTEPSA